MNVNELLVELSHRGVKLWVENDQLCIAAPKGSLTPELRNALAASKAELLAVLQKTSGNTAIAPITPVPRKGNLQLSLAQERLWFLEQLEPGSPVYNLSLGLRLSGVLDAAALEQSLREIVRRHETLRTTFPTVDGGPIQSIASEVALPLTILDLSEIPARDRETEAKRLGCEAARQPFDLAQGPLMRISLLRFAEDDHVLLLVMHHIISDGWSIMVFFRELTALYNTFSTGKPEPLPVLPIQYADFAAWQRQGLQGEALESQFAYWQQQLEGNIQSLHLPTDRPQPVVQSYQGDRQSLEFSKSLSDGLKSLSQKEGVTLFVTLLTAFQILLNRYTGQEDLIVCSPVVGRNQSETEGLIGYFNNILPLRVDLSGDPSVRDVLSRVRRITTDAFEHQNLPFQKLSDLPNLARTSLTRALFNLQNAPVQALDLVGIRVSSLPIHSGTANFDLSLFLEEKGEMLVGAVDYRTTLFNADSITQLLERFQFLLESLVANPEQSLSSLPQFPYNPPQPLTQSTSDTTGGTSEKLFETPRTLTEELLAQLWMEVLGIEAGYGRNNQISIHDSFFELGGHSLVVARLISRIREVLQVNLPLRCLFEAPTIAGLAAAIEILSQTNNGQGEAKTEGWNYLIPMQPSGSRTPFFLVPGGEGGEDELILYAKLVYLLGQDQPVYGFQARGRDGKREIHANVEAMAADYIREIRTLQPEGPYLIGGECMGGVVAYEIAQQLQAQGQQVALLVLMDAWCPNDTLELGYRLVGDHLDKLVRLDTGERLSYLASKAQSAAGKLLTKLRTDSTAVATPAVEMTDPGELTDENGSANFSKIYKEYVKVVLHYRPRPYSGAIALLISEDYVHEDPLKVWGPLATGGLEIHRVQGVHYSYLGEHVQTTAEQLKVCLEGL